MTTQHCSQEAPWLPILSRAMKAIEEEKDTRISKIFVSFALPAPFRVACTLQGARGSNSVAVYFWISGKNSRQGSSLKIADRSMMIPVLSLRVTVFVNRLVSVMTLTLNSRSRV